MSTQKIELIRTSQSWDGAELPNYLPAAVVGSAQGDGGVETCHGASLQSNFIFLSVFEKN